MPSTIGGDKKRRKREEEPAPKSRKKPSQTLPPELSGVKLNPNAIPELGDAVEQMFRKKLAKKVQKDPMLAVFDEAGDSNRKIDRKLRKKDKKESKEKKKKKRNNKREEEKRRSPVQSSVIVAQSSKWDKYDTASTVQRRQNIAKRTFPSKLHHRPISHGDWRDDRWKGKMPTSDRPTWHDPCREAWPPAAAVYNWDDGRRKEQEENMRSNAQSSRSSNYTGYVYRTRSRSRSIKEADRRPSPPRNMPEHIRWLHERWTGMGDRNSFSKQEKLHDEKRAKETTEAEKKSYKQKMPEYRRDHRFHRRGLGANDSSPSDRHFEESKPDNRPKAAKRFGIPYYQFRSGSEYSWNPGRMFTFKEFLMSKAKDIDDQEEALQAYNDYKSEFRKKALAEFFQAHSDDEWFLEKYHPMLRNRLDGLRRAKVAKRLDAFMHLLVRGFMEVSLDFVDSKKIRKLMDAVIVLLEGGDEGDIACLNDLDYVLEEKKDQSYELKPVAATETMDSSDEEKVGIEINPRKIPDTIGKAPGQGRSKEEQEADEVEGYTNEEKLERMQHALDYSLYVREREGPDMSEAPDDFEPDGADSRETNYVGSGVFVSQSHNRKPLEEMNLHKVSALLLKNIPPSVSRQELEELCLDAHCGYLRLHMAEPDPNSKYHRDCIVCYWYNANLKKICWKLHGTRLRGVPLVVVELREFKRRIEIVEGLAGDKSVVLRDIQLCKSLIEYLDKKEQLWGQKGVEEIGEEERRENNDNSTAKKKLSSVKRKKRRK